MPRFRISEAAELLGVSADTVRRWVDSERLPADRDDSGRRLLEGADLAAFMSAGSDQDPARRTSSARNRFRGLVTNVVRDRVMASVEIQAGPHRVLSLMSREAADELGLEVGSTATAVVKSTNVVIESTGDRHG
ncbi:TOBE domain-containing protein [Nocardiopsis kunsanensis]|uniref:MerR family transcriptional regulator n=1 Tax=Nocardiopsis kunsanensis TaxID=141693 RepID=A0A919CF56_9ACTN|nr:TOBE domain-containing protein [Nocardiopsis kunsanensis]GHD17339.1 MerR family transcriptional regulator [Nocardiopsis kunsanensis]